MQLNIGVVIKEWGAQHLY